MSGDVCVIAGLGNPGEKYSGTRHNAGFWFLDGLAGPAATFQQRKGRPYLFARRRIGGIACHLVKPTSFMNHSGAAVRAFLDWYKLDAGALLVAHDELDLPPGTARLKAGGGHGGHNGLRDLERHLGTRDYLRLRIGIGHPGRAEQVTPYVLTRPTRTDRDAIQAAIERAIEVLPLVVGGETGQAMNLLHRSD